MNAAKDSTTDTTGAPPRSTTLDARLLAVLACPEDKGPLYYVPAENLLYNPRLHRRYDIVDGIPVMLVEEATTVDDTEHDRLQAVIEREGIAPTFEPAK
ncbi:MAG TPA: Trm112 family protein [Ilumatobacteraceae bacterium]